MGGLLGNLHGRCTNHGGETGRIAGAHQESRTERAVDALHYTLGSTCISAVKPYVKCCFV